MSKNKKESGLFDSLASEDRANAKDFITAVIVDDDMSDEDKEKAEEVAEAITKEATRLFDEFPLLARLVMSVMSTLNVHDEKLDLLRGFAMTHEDKLEGLKDLMVEAGLVQMVELRKKPVDKTMLN